MGLYYTEEDKFHDGWNIQGDNYVEYSTGTVNGIFGNGMDISVFDTPEQKEKESKKKMDNSNDGRLVSDPYVFGTDIGEYSVIFTYERGVSVWLNEKSDKSENRDVSSAQLTNHPFNPYSKNFVNNYGVAVRRPTEQNSKFAGRLYALVDALNTSTLKLSVKRVILFGYLRSLDIDSQVCNFIVNSVNLQ